MNPARWKRVSIFLFCASVIFLGATLALPQTKSGQNVFYHGPAVSYFGGDTALSGYYIPTVNKGSEVNVSFSNFIPGSLEVSVFPAQGGDIAPSGGPIFLRTLNANFTLSFKAEETQPYGMYVISHNMTTFNLRIEATFSAYDWLKTYTVAGISAVFGTAVLLYYYSFTEKRWKLEQKAIREARS